MTMARFEYERPSAVEIPKEELESMAAVMRSGGGGPSYDYAGYVVKACGFMENTVEAPLRKFAAALDNSAFASKGDTYLAWMFFRLLGGFNYDDEFNKELSWDLVAGPMTSFFSSPKGVVIPPEERSFFVDTLGMSDGDYRSLRYWVRLQHEACAASFKAPEDDGPWTKWVAYFTEDGKFTKPDGSKASVTRSNIKDLIIDPAHKAAEGHVDFSHMCITVAAMLAAQVGLVSAAVGGALGAYNKPLYDRMGPTPMREALAGWLGDAVLLVDGKTSFGDDDCKSDLDALRIADLIRNDAYTFKGAIESHYGTIASYTRKGYFLSSYMQLSEAVACMRVADEKSNGSTNKAWLKKIKGDGSYADTYKFYKILKGTEPEPSLW